MKGDNTRTNIKTIGKAARVLKVISLGFSKLSDISREVDICKNGVYRLLYSLKQEGLVVQDPVTREYFMGPLLYEISANHLILHQRLINCSYLEMEDLRRVTGETVSLDIKFGMERLVLRQLIGTHNITFVGKTNPFDHLWIGAAGKVLLAQLGEHELKMILDQITLVARTPYSITDKTVFKKEIEKVRERGYSAGYNELEIGRADIAVPIEGYIVPASLAIVGPEDRLSPQTMDFVNKLKIKARKISQHISKN